MENLSDQAACFRQSKDLEAARACQMAATQIVLGVDLEKLISGPSEPRLEAVKRLQRTLKRERLKGLRRRSYDLNRHIALKQALDRLTDPRCGK